MFYCSFLISVFLLLFIGSVQTSYGQSVQSSPSLFPHDSKPFNDTMGKWLERYWIWVAAIPEDVHPRGDTTGVNCGTNQSGPVWYLDPPVKQEQNDPYRLYCEIPENKAIFVPILLSECDEDLLKGLLNKTTVTDSEISECTKKENDRGKIKFGIDGKTLISINGTTNSEEQYSLYRTTSDFFNIFIVKNNIFEDAPSGTYRAQADGYFAIVQPLALGDHEIEVYNHRPQSDNPVAVNATFNIKIVRNQNSSS